MADFDAAGQSDHARLMPASSSQSALPAVALRTGVDSNLAGSADAPRAPSPARRVNFRILGAIASLASATVLARGLGTVNQVVVSDRFGAGPSMDAYFAAVAAPTLVAALVVTAAESAVIPTYIRLTQADQRDDAADVLSTLLNVILLALAALTVAMLLFPRYTVLVFAPGLPARTVAIGVGLIPLIVPTMLLNTFIGFVTAILNASERFAWPAYANMLVPAGMMLATLALGQFIGIPALAIGLLGGTVLQGVAMIVLTRGKGFRYRPVIRVRHVDARVAFTQFWPMLIGGAVGQANPLIDQMVASSLGTGGISWLNYALKIVSVPVTVVFMACGRAVFPYFSSQVAAKDFTSLKQTLALFAWLVGAVTLAISMAFVVLSGVIVGFILRHGAFTALDSRMTAATLIGFSIGLCPMALGFLIPRVYLAMHRGDLLMKLAVIMLGLNAVLDLLFAHFFGVPGIALGTSADYAIATGVQIILLRRMIGPMGLLHPSSELWNLRALMARLKNPVVV